MSIVIVLMIFSLSLTGCNIGLKTKNTIIYASMSKPLEYKGLVRVAQDERITVTVDGKVAEIKAGGFYLVHKADLKTLLDKAKK